MSEDNTDKKYESIKIPDRQQDKQDGCTDSSPRSNPQPNPATPVSSDGSSDSSYPLKLSPASSGSTTDLSSPPKTSPPVSSSESYFYEIEYDSNPVPGVGRFVLKPQQIAPPAKDEIRELFAQMKDISRAHHSAIDYSRFFDRRVYNDNAFIFYKQGMFMKDFTDDYKDTVPFSTYFPYYQLMGYEQLRTYFTWRTDVRKGNIADVSLSYAFLYIYELLNNIGADNPEDALDKLMHFWKKFSLYNSAIDRYMLRWLKDYHIFYELPQTFKNFVGENNLAKHYPNLVDSKNNFELLCSISKYDIRKSVFFMEDRENLVTDCFYYVIERFSQIILVKGFHFDAVIFNPTRKISAWKPFRDALFYQCIKQPDKRVVISENELYMCNQNTWTYSKELTSGNGRALVGYIFKKMESVLRLATKYKTKLTANISAVNHEIIIKLNEQGLSLDKIISDAVFEFYREINRTVVSVNHEALSKIRQDALSIQQKLIVPERDESIVSAAPLSNMNFSDFDKTATDPSTEVKLNISDIQKTVSVSEPDVESDSIPDVWESFKNALTPTEKDALSIVLSENMELKKFADECGIMLEVLVDSINEKAMDFISDNIMNEEFEIYDEYKDNLKNLLL